MKIGVTDAGGGFRGVYGCAVLDSCLNNGIHFDYAIGVSAGSANLISYLAGQRGRNYRFYTDYGFRKQYASFGNFVRKRSYVDMDYVYGTLSNTDGEDPLDFDALMANPAEYFAVACNVETGEPVYLRRLQGQLRPAGGVPPLRGRRRTLSGRRHGRPRAHPKGL